MKRYSRAHIGKTYTTNEGYDCEIIDGGSRNHYCTIKIENWITEVCYDSVKKGVIKYPYHPSVHDVGFTGEGKYKAWENRKLTKAYILWHGMLRRAYDDKFHESRPTYKDVEVSEEWHNFQNFAKWFEDNYVEGWHLDKDLLSEGKKVYSSETCIFIPAELNLFLTNNKLTNNSGFTGVSYHKKAKKWRADINNGKGNRLHLGRYNTKEEAGKAYDKKRAEYAKEWQNKMQGILPEKVIEKIK